MASSCFFYLQLAVPWLRNKLLSWAEKRFRVWPTYTRWGKCTETSREPTSCFQTKVCRISRNDKDFEIRRNPLNWCSTVYIDFSYLIQEDVPLMIQIFFSRRGEACGLRCLRPGMVTNILFSLDLFTTDWVLEKPKGHQSVSVSSFFLFRKKCTRRG